MRVCARVRVCVLHIVLCECMKRLLMILMMQVDRREEQGELVDVVPGECHEYIHVHVHCACM